MVTHCGISGNTPELVEPDRSDVSASTLDTLWFRRTFLKDAELKDAATGTALPVHGTLLGPATTVTGMTFLRPFETGRPGAEQNQGLVSALTKE